MQRYKTGDLDRHPLSMIPFSYDEMIGEDNAVRVIDAFVEMLDIKDCKHYETKETGRKPYSPKDMIKLYVYGYFNGIRTSRKLEKECCRNIEVMWLLGEIKPDFKTIADFRKDNKKMVKSTFAQFSRLCSDLGMYGKEIVAIDGSKFRANNARKQNFTKGKVAKQISHYEECAEKYLKLLDKADKAEKEENRLNISKEELMEKLKNAQKRIEELNELQKEIEANGEVSKTDPDSRHMSVSNNGTDISHNVQIAVDSKYHLVVAIDVTSNPTDQGQLYNMAEQAKEELGVEEITALADKGYYNGEDLKKCEENGVNAIVSKQKFGSHTGDANYAKDKFIYNKEKDVFICPQGHKMKCISGKNAKQIRYKSKKCKNCSVRENCTKSDRGREIVLNEYQEYYDRADAKFAKNLKLYKQRQMIVEHPFGTVKRALGYTYFLQRRTGNVKCESVMHFLVYNLKRVINIVGIKPLIEAMRAKKQETALKISSISAVSIKILYFAIFNNKIGGFRKNCA